ncbi:glycosyltransferase family 4 protein [Rhodocyclus tenuis]|uniref:Glycosyltransferase family 4 protein n=1 Tax=Rhodocyclus gracilis TaxID=2929842 RepID=A0ABX0WNI7_9RHOO|nr:glycosyltransferase family 4 protein [Rhodocyclus gracilis]MRD74004.1 glycosyltransferase [Rhodocyclus gracilis]NJA89988.1 glycosyltransferase family 4 protein [Rhodocyclus gracilis]
MTFRIVHTEWSDGWGGQERRILAEMIEMLARGHHVWLATRADAQLATRAKAAGIPVLVFPFSGKFDLRTIIPLAAFCRTNAVGILNTHSGIDAWIGGFASLLARCHLVRTRHLNLPLHRRWYNFVHYLADHTVTCGEVMRENLVKHCGFPESQVTSIPTGVDLKSFKARRNRESVRCELGLDPHHFAVLMVGVIRAVKRHEVALRAFSVLHKQLPNARLLLAGEGPMRQGMEELAQSLGLQDAVQFLGHREDIPDLMSAADCLLLTSRSEGVPQVLTQGLYCGIPTVATAVGGVPEVILHEKTGLLVPAEDVNGITAALLRLHSDQALRIRLAATGKAHVAEKFSLEAMANATERLYENIEATH